MISNFIYKLIFGETEKLESESNEDSFKEEKTIVYRGFKNLIINNIKLEKLETSDVIIENCDKVILNCNLESCKFINCNKVILLDYPDELHLIDNRSIEFHNYFTSSPNKIYYTNFNYKHIPYFELYDLEEVGVGSRLDDYNNHYIIDVD